MSEAATIARPVGGGEMRPAHRAAPAASWNCLSIDVEEYFHCEAFAGAVRPEQWPQYPHRAAARLETIAELLDRHSSKATFFVLAWSARYLRSLLRTLTARGHEIACHGYGHQHLARMTPQSLADDLRRAQDIVAEVVGISVVV